MNVAYRLFCAILLWGALGHVIAQIVSGTMLGRAADATGAVVPNARITVTNSPTGVQRTTSTDDQGNFALSQPPPCSYSISATATGFKTYQVSNIELQVDQTARVDVEFQIGQMSQEIAVVAVAAPVESETSSLGHVITTNEVLQLPLNERNFMRLANISSGVAPAYTARSATITNQSGQSDLAVHISGARGDANSYLIDGVENAEHVVQLTKRPALGRRHARVQDREEGVFIGIRAEQRDRERPPEQFGRATACTGPRTNFAQFRSGCFFDNFFGRPKAPFKQNQYGLTASGALIKNKLFFFGNWESLHSRKSNTLNTPVPTPAQLHGQLAGFPSSKGSDIDPLTGAPFPGNVIVIPTDRISCRMLICLGRRRPQIGTIFSTEFESITRFPLSTRCSDALWISIPTCTSPASGYLRTASFRTTAFMRHSGDEHFQPARTERLQRRF
jgi:hypothetical protein